MNDIWERLEAVFKNPPHEGVPVTTDRDKEINAALAFSDMLDGSGNVGHHIKVLAQAVRTLRRENAKLLAAANKYQEGWDDASRQYQAQAAGIRPSDARKEMLEVITAQHNALDTVMAQLIILTHRYTPAEPFYPSTSGLAWEAVTRAQAVLQRAKSENIF
jgi:hypothetical protein